MKMFTIAAKYGGLYADSDTMAWGLQVMSLFELLANGWDMVITRVRQYTIYKC
jgi:hypothetical protein